MIKKQRAAHPRAVTDAGKLIGQRLRMARIAKKMSQDELGGALGISFQMIQKYEKGVNRIASDRLPKIAALLDTSAAHLLGDDAKNSPSSQEAEQAGLFTMMSTSVGLRLIRGFARLSISQRLAFVKLMDEFVPPAAV